MTDSTGRPFLKWAGGKRWLSSELIKLLRPAEGQYFEPFLGSGAVFFALQPTSAFLADLNDDLIVTYRALKEDVDSVIRQLESLAISRDEYNHMRGLVPQDATECAVRFIYLNRTAFNGLYRVNRAGEFNVPFGCKPGTKLYDAALFRDCARQLVGVELSALDFRDSLDRVTTQDCLYVDPPYTVLHNNNGFRRYNETLFSWRDQVALSEKCNELARCGVRIVVTNALHSDVQALYDPRFFSAWAVCRNSRMSASPGSRGPCSELVLTSHALEPLPHLKGFLRIPFSIQSQMRD